MPLLIFIYSMMWQLICKYEPFIQEVSVEYLILRWPLRPLGLLLFSPEQLGIYQPFLAENVLRWICQTEGPYPSSRGENDYGTFTCIIVSQHHIVFNDMFFAKLRETSQTLPNLVKQRTQFEERVLAILSAGYILRVVIQIQKRHQRQKSIRKQDIWEKWGSSRGISIPVFFDIQLTYQSHQYKRDEFLSL